MEQDNKIKDWADTIVQMDCVEGMSQLPDQSVDLLIADPPYNLSKGGKLKHDDSSDLPGMGGSWVQTDEKWDTMDTESYFEFTMSWLEQAKRIVKSTGSLWIHGTYHNMGAVNMALQNLKIEIINEVIWFKRNAFPNLSNRRLTASHENILWAHTGGKKRQYRFNAKEIKAADFPEDSIKMPGKQMRTVWDIPSNKDRSELAHGKHPTQKPLRLARRLIAISAGLGDLCLVPFAGSGTECIAAMQSGLNFIGFELEEEYIKIAQERIAAAQWEMSAQLPLG